MTGNGMVIDDCEPEEILHDKRQVDDVRHETS
jgi:hypothetical protein